MKALDSFIENLYTGEPAEFRRLRVTPVFMREEAGLPCLEFEEALRAGLVEVTEVSEGGSVPNLLVRNDADRDVLILDGEQLVGAKQNRVVNTTVVVAAHTPVEIPVSCVEQGRWGYSSRSFTSGHSHASPSLRSLKHRSVTASLRAAGRYASDQGGIWNEIRSKSERLAAASPTMSLGDVYASSVSGEDERQLEEEMWVEFPRLTAEEVIRQVRESNPEQFASVGKGSELRFESGYLQGALKVVDEFIPHLMVFPKLN